MRHRVVGWLAVVLCSVGVSAHAADLAVEGQDYQLINPAQPTSNPGKIVVTEFFSYQCPHCFVFYPIVTSWATKLPKDAIFERVPVTFGRKDWAAIAQAFYALDAIDKLEAMDKLIFSAIHVQRIALNDEDSITQFFAKQGISAQQFSAAYNSFGVKSSLARADMQARAERIQGTPSMVVDGKYLVLSEGTRGYEELLERTDKVIATARAARAKK